MTTDIQLKDYDPKRTHFDSKDGEIHIPTNAARRGDGAYANAPTPAILHTLPAGHTPIALHTTSGGARHIITLKTSTNDIYWTKAQPQIATHDLRQICQVSDIADTAIDGDTITVATAEGLLHLLWTGDTYESVDTTALFPEIQFGLNRIGTLNKQDTITIKAGDSPASAILNNYTDAINAQATAKGHFHQPFLLRYALRMADGTHILPSAPILMLPTVLPPQIGVNVEDTSDQTIRITTDHSAIGYHELRYRITHACPTSALITAIDIYVSEEITTYDKTRTAQATIAKYSSIAEATNTGWTQRGRATTQETPTDASTNSGDTEKIFDGHYSTDGRHYTDHYLASSQMDAKVLALPPNPHFSEDIRATDTYYKIASLPYPLPCSQKFTPIEIDTTDFTNLRQKEHLNDNPTSHRKIIATSITHFDNRLHICSNSAIPPKPFTLQAAGAFDGDEEAAAGADITITAYLKVGCKTIRAIRHCQHFPGDAPQLPRYLYYPDKRAYQMDITHDGTTKRLRLEPCTTLDGSCWMGETETITQDTDTTDETSPKTTDNDTESHLYVTRPNNSYAISEADTLDYGNNKTHKILPILKMPKTTTTGKHKAYLFTQQGIQILEYSNTEKRYNATQTISDTTCTTPQAATAAARDVYYAAADTIYRLSGDETTDIGQTLKSHTFDPTQLPYADQILAATEMQKEETTLKEFLQHCQAAYIPDTRTVIFFTPEAEYTLSTDTESGSWAILSSHIESKIASNAESTLNDGESHIITLKANEDTNKTLIITRPIKLGTPIEHHNLCQAEVLGDYTHINIAVYGTDCLRHHTLIATSTTGYAEQFDTKAYRYLRIVIYGELQPDEYIYGLKLTTGI